MPEAPLPGAVATMKLALFVFNQFGDLERSMLRPGNVHSADGWDGTSSRSLCVIRARSRASISGRRCWRAGRAARRPRRHVAAVGPAQFLQPLQEDREASLSFRIVGGQVPEHADATHPVGLLRARGERPHQCCAAQSSYEFPPSDIDRHWTLHRGHAHRIIAKDSTPRLVGLSPTSRCADGEKTRCFSAVREVGCALSPPCHHRAFERTASPSTAARVSNNGTHGITHNSQSTSARRPRADATPASDR